MTLTVTQLQREHVVIVHRRYAGAIVEGRKTIECRLSAAKIPPFGRVSTGDVLHFKISGGGFFARASAGRVLSTALADAADIERLRADYDAHILGDDAYWQRKAAARYATLIWLTDVRPPGDVPPVYRRGTRSAWHVLGR